MVKLLNYTEYPLQTIGQCAGDCWGASLDDKEKNIKRAKNCIASNHGRVLEYADFTVELSEYSIKVMRELYTHIIGTTRTQESTRYVPLNNFKFVTPPKIANNIEAKENYENLMSLISDNYAKLIEMGIPKEDASMILPLSTHTKVVLKMNVRALQHFCNMRLCNRAYWEIRQLTRELINELAKINDEWKFIVDTLCVPNCVAMGYCPESKKISCGIKPTKDELLNK